MGQRYRSKTLSIFTSLTLQNWASVTTTSFWGTSWFQVLLRINGFASTRKNHPSHHTPSFRLKEFVGQEPPPATGPLVRGAEDQRRQRAPHFSLTQLKIRSCSALLKPTAFPALQQAGCRGKLPPCRPHRSHPALISLWHRSSHRPRAMKFNRRNSLLDWSLIQRSSRTALRREGIGEDFTNLY